MAQHSTALAGILLNTLQAAGRLTTVEHLEIIPDDVSYQEDAPDKAEFKLEVSCSLSNLVRWERL